MTLPSLLGMVHLAPLPGSPGFDSAGGMKEVVRRASADAEVLASAGFPALMVENYGDAPFFPEHVPPVTVSALTVAVEAIGSAVGLPLGVNALRNDPLAALAVAAATGASWIRVNVLSGLMYTDQGPISGRAAEVARARAAWCPEVGILADVFVKHASPPPGLTFAQSVLDLWERAGADALIISGTATGAAPDLDRLRQARSLLPEAPLLVGSGANVGNLSAIAEFADGAIVGSALKVEGRAQNPVDAEAAAAFVLSARKVGWLPSP